MTIALIVGLGNPGTTYQNHRHNVGFWFVDHLATIHHVSLRKEQKFFGDFAEIEVANQRVKLLKPTTFMNHSGRSIQALKNFFNLAPEQILLAHDELDFKTGVVKLKQNGGHGGHNGLRDAINALGSHDFYRLRLGISHPGSADLVTKYVLNNATANERTLLQLAIERATSVLPDIVTGRMDVAMNALHKEETESGS